MKNFDIIKAYTKGEIALDAANEALKNNGAGFHLDPHKHDLTPDEIMNGTAGLLDSGTVTLDKVRIDRDNMELIDCDMGSSFALCIVQGKTYEVKGKKLVEQ